MGAVTFRVTVPATTPAGAVVYIAGDFQGWNPGHPTSALTDVGGRVHEITLNFEVGTSLQFKFTRGAWGSVEKGGSGEEIANRVHQVTGDATLSLTVANWADLPANSTITGDVTLVTVPGFLNGRRVWIYLPPGYHDALARRYPVLYMLDGQNVFDTATSFAGEWRVDETCEALIATQLMAPIIVVAVANGEAGRINEYTPWFDPAYSGGVGGGGEAHLQEFINVLMPFINAGYRTLTGPDDTGLAGSSLGGLMSLYAAHSHPEAFGRIAALSPSIWWKNSEVLSYAAGQPKPPSRIYTDMGTLESGTFRDNNGNGIDDSIDSLRAMRDVLIGQGFVPGGDLMTVEDEGGRHSESYWAARFPSALRFLFPLQPSAVPAGVVVAGPLTVRPNVPNPFNPSTFLQFELSEPAAVTLAVYDLGGRLVRELLKAGARTAGAHTVEWDGRDSRGGAAPSGVYIYRVTAGAFEAGGRMVLAR